MKRIYVHIGLEKTGTTSLQIFLQKNCHALNSNNLVYLGDADKSYVHGIGHFPIAASFFKHCPDFVPIHKHRPASVVLKSLSRDVEKTNLDIILSCEHFSSKIADRRHIEAFRDALLGRAVTIICYIRRQDDQALSHYSTLVKAGCTKPFDISNAKPNNRYFNYRQILEDWAAVFGHENIIIREYSRSSLVSADICMDFLSQLGLDHSPFNFIEDQNVALDSLQVELLRRVNKYLPPFKYGGSDIDMKNYEKAQRVRQALIPILPKSEDIRALLQQDQRQVIMQRFESENIQITESFSRTDFILRWHIKEPAPTPPPVLANPKMEEFERSLAAAGQQLETYISELSNLSERNEQLRAQRDAAMGANDRSRARRGRLVTQIIKAITSPSEN